MPPEDSVRFECMCGKTLRVAARLRGKKVRCPSCHSLMIVPGAEGGFEVIDDEPVAGARTAVKAVRKPPPREVEPEPDEEDEPKPPTRKRKRRGLSGRMRSIGDLPFASLSW